MGDNPNSITPLLNVCRIAIILGIVWMSLKTGAFSKALNFF